ncbi:MAG: hypothetical protein A3E83_05700 [Gammaproteobacteria bacterium RIFCSPHIGHO2_12_FULL_41_20]|nr:MAG: hypothetical protein A3E83_05700 [Gammaproteobacteria bacterium RIFCSPHIGHO2_12_FULL_41_20]
MNMTRDGKKQVFAARRALPKRQWRGLLTILSLSIVVGMGGGIIYKQSSSSHLFVDYGMRFSHWLYQLWHKPTSPVLAKVKRIVNRPSEPPPIHFEFYTALANAEVPLPSLPPPVSAAVNVPTTMAATVVSTETVIKNPMLSVEHGNAELPDAGERYMVQLGVFEEASGAARLRSALAEVGFASEVVKTAKNKRTLYRVQQGPFTNQVQARAMQQRLQKRGITSIIHREKVQEFLLKTVR